MSKQVYTIGRGKILFQPEGGAGFDDFGNVPDFKVSFKTEKKEHFSYRQGLKVKDQEIVLAIEANVSFSTDSLSLKNLQKIFLADIEELEQTTGNLNITLEVYKEQWFKLEKYNLGDDIEVKKHDDSTVEYEEGTDYLLDKAAGLIYIMPDGDIADGTEIDVTGSYGAFNGKKLKAAIKSGVKGRLLFVADPPKGTVIDLEGDVELAPEGDFELISDDYIKAQFTGTFTKPEEVQHLYEVIVREIR